MSEKILSDGEMDALMEGVADGSIAIIRDGGVERGRVQPFEIRPQNHLSFGSYPALQRLNEGFATRVQRYMRQALNWPASCDLLRQYECTSADIVTRFDGLQHIMGFRLEPLDGLTCLVPDVSLVPALVEVCFGSTAIPPADPTIEEFSVGQKRTAERFANQLMELLATAWAPFVSVAPKFADSWNQVERVPLGLAKEKIIVSDYQIVAEEFEARFTVFTTSKSLAEFAPRLDGAEQPGSAEQNQHWRELLERHVFELPVQLDVCNEPHAQVLAGLQALAKGDQLAVAAPNPVGVSCGDMPLMTGEFGVAGGRRVLRIQTAL